jgi:hypothetical protein
MEESPQALPRRAQEPDAWVQILTLPLTSCVALNKSHSATKPQFPHL